MLFTEAFITNDGSDLFDRASTNFKTIEWSIAAATFVDNNSKTADEMKAKTSETFGSFTCEGRVTSAYFDSNTNSILLKCELDNSKYYGMPAKTFGIWAKCEEDESSVLAIIARDGSSVATETINERSQGTAKYFIDASVSMINHRYVKCSVSAYGYKAPIDAVERVKTIADELNAHTLKGYNNLWDAMKYSKNGDVFSYLTDDPSGDQITMLGIDNDTFTMPEIYPMWMQDNLFFFWYYLAKDGPSVPHIVIASIDELRKGTKRRSLFNNVGLYSIGEQSAPIYISDNLILYQAQALAPVDPLFHVISRSDYKLVQSNVPFTSFPIEVPTNASLTRLLLSRAGNVAIFEDGDGNSWYVFGLKLGYSSRNGIFIISYDKVIEYNYESGSSLPERLTEFGKFGNNYWAVGRQSDVSNSYIFTASSLNVFKEVLLEDDGSSIVNAGCPCYSNTMIFSNGNGLYSITNVLSSKAKQLYQYDSAMSGDLCDSYGILGKCFGLGRSMSVKLLPYGVYEIDDFGIAMPTIPTAINYEIDDYYDETARDTYYRLRFSPIKGDFSKCTNQNGLIIPVFKM